MKLHNPPMPLSTPIEGRLVPGSKIIIVGWPKEKCANFNINLKLGPHDEEIALHISARFKPKVKTPVVIRNHLTSAGWGQEETDTPHFPFLTKSQFKIEILCERARFRISVDDTVLCKFTHRLPLAYINHLEVQGDAEITYVETPEFVGAPRGDFDSGHPMGWNNLSIKGEDYDEN